MDKDLRLLAGAIIVTSKISKIGKQQLLRFVKEEASDAQVKALLMDGEMVKLDEQAEEIVNERFRTSEAGGRIAKLRKTYMSRSATSNLGAGAIWLLYRKIRSKFDVCTKRCGKFEVNTARRQYCMLQCKVGKLQAKVAAASKAKNEKEHAKNKLALVKAKAALMKSHAAFEKQKASI